MVDGEVASGSGRVEPVDSPDVEIRKPLSGKKHDFSAELKYGSIPSEAQALYW